MFRPSVSRILGVAAAVVTVSSCTSVVQGDARPGDGPAPASPAAPAPPGEKLVSPKDIKYRLLKASELGEIVGDTDMKIARSFPADVLDTVIVEPVECISRPNLAKLGLYGLDNQRGQVGDINRGAAGRIASQLITVFDSDRTARELVHIGKYNWTHCPEGSEFTTEEDLVVTAWKAGPTSGDARRAQTGFTRRDAPPRSCQHVAAARLNVVIESMACGDGDTAAQANRLADRLLKNFPE